VSRYDVMKTYIPVFLRNSNVILSILNAEGEESDDVRAGIRDILNQFYVETATEIGLTLWEQMLGLSSYAGKPLSQRRSRIISKIRGIGTLTVNLIKNVAESYVYGTVEVIEDTASYSFIVKFIDALGAPPNLQDLMDAIEDIKPAHLAVQYEYKYLLINEIHNTITLNDMEMHQLTDFAPFEPVL